MLESLGQFLTQLGIRLSSSKTKVKPKTNLIKPFIYTVSLVIVLLLSGHAWGQDSEPSRLELTGIDTSTLPIISLRLIGVQSNGQRIDTTQTPIEIQHGAETISQEQFVSIDEESVGTLTLVLLDTPSGVAAELVGIQEAVQIFAGNEESSYMVERMDTFGIYAVDFSDPKILLEPTFFRNSVINWLADEPPIQEGSTALYDSLDSLLGQVDGLKPRPEMIASIVVFTDGTDSVSTRTDEVSVIQKAVDLNVPIHTVHLNNSLIFNPDEGQRFLQNLSDRTGGYYTELNQEGINLLWGTVSSLGRQIVIRYRPAEPVPGNVPIAARMRDYPTVEAFTSAQFPADQLKVEFGLEEYFQTAVMPDLAQPLEISIPVEVSWLDGRERAISTAQVLRNGEFVAELPVSEDGLATADVSLTGLAYGPNEIILAVMDENGNRGNSSALTLNVAPGDSLIVPEPIAAGRSFSFGRSWLFGLIGIIVLLAVAAYWILFSGAGGKQIKIADLFSSAFSSKPRRRSRSSEFQQPDEYNLASAGPGASFGDETAVSVQTPDDSGMNYWLDVIDSDGTDPISLPLIGLEQRLGRSPSKADLSFEKEQTVSRIHATFAREANSYRLYDEQSTAGTYVNGVPLPDYGQMLVNGDEIQMGALVLRFRQS